MAMTTNAKGSDDTTMSDCSPDKAFSPPARSNETAVKLSSRPQVIVTGADGSGIPLWVSELMTMEAESADVTKNISIEIMAMTGVTDAKGKFPSTLNNNDSGELPAVLNPRPFMSMCTAVPPKITNHVTQTSDGTITTTVTNSRNVRPREILAINIPTKNAQETHHAQ